MNLLYIGIHEVLEADELSLFTELGIDCFSFLGAYMHPEGHPSLKRPGIPNLKYNAELAEEANRYAKTKIPQEFFDRFDIIVIMHDPFVVVENWERMKHKTVIWRSIGQSTLHVEKMLKTARDEGMKIVRMSPMEKNIVGYLGEDATIRFYKNPYEWEEWNGREERAINFTQSLKGRRVFCHYDAITSIMNGVPSLIYGSGNTDLAGLDGGELTYDLMKGALRDNRCFVYGGTFPSPYTLALIEAMMTGIPIVSIGRKLAEDISVAVEDKYHYYEIENIIRNGVNGFISDNISELKEDVDLLLKDKELAKKIGDEGRKTAIDLFGQEMIRKQWEVFFKTL